SDVEPGCMGRLLLAVRLLAVRDAERHPGAAYVVRWLPRLGLRAHGAPEASGAGHLLVNRWYYAAWGLLSIVMFGGVLALGLKTEDRKGGVPEPTATEHASSPSSHLPPARPEYARTFQGIVDAARPKGEGRIIVKGCYAGRQGNEHFCVWVA